MLDTTTSPPPPPTTTLKTLAVPPTASTAEAAAISSPSSISYSPSLLIITAIIIFVGLASFAIHLLLRLFSRRPPLPLVYPSSSLSSSLSSSFRAPESAPADLVCKEKEKKDREAAIESLPVFTLASALAAAPRTAADCAVCLSRFRSHDELRLLPACRHAFHQDCVDAWLRNTPSCPLCRASIYLPPASAAPPPQLSAAPVSSSITTMTDTARSGSFRVEIGSVSRRLSNASATDGETFLPPAPPSHVRSYSLGSSYEYLVEEEVEAVVARALRRPITKEQKPEEDGRHPPPPGAEVAEVAGGSSRLGGSWLRDYVERLASSASSSFSSIRFSSRRFDSSVAAAELWDMEAIDYRTTAATAAAEDGGFSSAFHRWFMGASS